MKIKHKISKSLFKASVIERAQYTLERLIFSYITGIFFKNFQKIFKFILAKEDLAYVGILQYLVRRYNRTQHSFTGILIIFYFKVYF